LTVIGRPASAPTLTPFARASSMAAASLRARSRSVTVTALIDVASAMLRASCASSNSRAETRFAFRSASIARAVA
jgi:hypothetical protein